MIFKKRQNGPRRRVSLGRRTCGSDKRLRGEPLEERRMVSLLGVTPSFPLLAYDSTGVVSYEAAAESFKLDATPLAFKASPTAPVRLISGAADIKINVAVDNNGNLLGGAAGHDLIITGNVDVDGNGAVDYSGTLLTGEVTQFGFLEAGTTDKFDFRFTLTGGALESYFDGYDVGVTTNSERSTFTGSFAVDFQGGAKGNVGSIEALVQPSSLAGNVWKDSNGDGIRDTGEPGIGSVQIALVDGAGNTVATTLTGSDGSYCFTDVEPGTYSLVETQPAGLLDGEEVAGAVGGTVDNSRDSNVIADIVLAGGEAASGYDFGEIEPSYVQGLVFEDFNNDGLIDFGETAIEGVTVTLSGTDDRGQVVSASASTDADGLYIFADLRPGQYTATETQPAGHGDGLDIVGTVNGVTVGANVVNDQLSAIEIAQPASAAEDYNFAERPATTGQLTSGQTATIGFWQNKNGQNLLNSLTGGKNSTQLGNWLAATFPNMYGEAAGASNLAGATNAQVATFYKDQLFKDKKKGALPGPAKVDAQTMAVAFAVYCTNSTLAGGNVAASFGFLVTESGVGAATINVGCAGAAFGVANYSNVAVIDMLLATNARTVNGILYDANGTRTIDSTEQLLRTMANEIYTTINETGDRSCPASFTT